ncbi:MAG: CoA transferase, partial [SAR202 cluster bacterium]|nr:CoA transferase [SAR202 cluster bacterium]
MADAGPVADVLVLDLTDEKGQYMGKLLGDMGARVIKVEPPAGDPARRIGPFAGESMVDPSAREKALPSLERSLYWWQFNTSKEGITLDLEQPAGQRLFKRLAERADIILESFSPGYLDRLGLGYNTLSALNPRLIMTSLTGFGQSGPYKDFLTSDLIALALGGQMASNGYDDVPSAPPIRGGGYQGYATGSHLGVIGTLVALFHRDLTGRGQYIDASIHEALAGTTEGAMPTYIYQGRPPMRQTGRHASATQTPRTQWPARDGKYVNTFSVPRNVASWVALVEWLAEFGIGKELTEDPKYRDAFVKGARAVPEIDHIWECIGKLVAAQPAEEAYEGGQRRGFAW